MLETFFIPSSKEMFYRYEICAAESWCFLVFNEGLFLSFVYDTLLLFRDAHAVYAFILRSKTLFPRSARNQTGANSRSICLLTRELFTMQNFMP